MKKLKLFNKNFQTSSEILLYDQIEVKWQSFNCQQSTVGRFEKTIIAFNYIRKILQLNCQQGSVFMSGLKYVRVLNITRFLICQGFEFPGLQRV